MTKCEARIHRLIGRNRYLQLLAVLFVTFIGYHYWSYSTSSVIKHEMTTENQDLFDSFNRNDVANPGNGANDQGVTDRGLTSCEVIHVAIVCAGHNASRDVVTLIKSILFYRNSLLHFHFIVDSPAKKILGTLFRTWNVPDLTVSFYSSKILEQKVSWIPNFHYSGVFGLLKLVIADILPSNIENIIVLDIDLVFLCDIDELWQIFKKFTKHQAVGLVENQSDWYLGNIALSVPWPAFGRGYNTGVILLNIVRLKEMQWNGLWNSVTKSELQNHEATQLADQDIINAVIKKNTHIVHTLSCLWNIQLSVHSRASECFNSDTSKIKVLHWNAPRRLKSEKVPNFLFHYFHSFSVADGNLLRKPVLKCRNEVAQILEDDFQTDLCQNMLDNVSELRRIHLYYFPYIYNSSLVKDVTLVAHLSMDRVTMLELIAMRWSGSISVGIYLSDHEAIELQNFVFNSPILSSRTNIGYHLVFEDLEHLTYPINFIRNIALQQARTEFVFLCDADFVPSSNLYEYLINSVLPLTDSHVKTAFIIPAFENLRYGSDIPETKSELLKQWDSGSALPFRMYLWPKGHNATDFSKWRVSNEPYSVTWTKNFEPYVVLPKLLCPNYDKRFFGFGWNKVTHVMELDAAGFRFSVLPYGFIIHLPHLASPDIRKFRSSEVYKVCVAELKTRFVEDLVKKYDISPDRYA